MKLIRKHVYSLALVLGLTCTIQIPTHAYAIIWDLGDTLIDVSKFCMAKQIGLSAALRHWLHGGMDSAQEKAFDIMTRVKLYELNFTNKPMRDNQPLPAIMLDWLISAQSNRQIYIKLRDEIRSLDNQNYFKSKLERRVVRRILKSMFNPESLGKCTRPIKPALRILRTCAQNKENQLFICSNWDAESFANVYNSTAMIPIFRWFNPDNIVISGILGVAKPNPAIYFHILSNYQLDPEETIFIDDDPVNVKAAELCGITGICMKDHNYTRLRTELRDLGAI